MNGKKTLIKFAGLSVLLNFLVKPIWLFFFDRKVQSILGNEAYGNYFSYFNIALIASVLLDFGISYWNNRSMAYQESEQRKMHSAILTIKLFFSLIFLGIGVSITVFSNLKGPALSLFWGAFMLQWFSHWLTFFRSSLSGSQRFGWDAIFSVLDRITAMFGVYWLITNHQLTSAHFAWIQALAYLLSAFLVLLILKKNHFQFKIGASAGTFQRIFKDSFPFFLMVLMMSLYARIDGIMLKEVFHSPESAGHYAAYFRLYEAGIMFPALIAGVLTPLLSRYLGQGQNPFDILQTGASWILIPGISFFALCVSFPIPIFDWVNAENNVTDLATPTMMGLVGWVFLMHAVVYIYGSYLTALGSIRYLVLLAFFACTTTALAHYLFIPRWGIIGAGIATAIGHSLMAIGCTIKSFQSSLIFPGWKKIGIIVLFISIITVLVFWNPFLFEIGAPLLLIVILCLSLALKLLSFGSWKNLVPKK